MQAVAGLNGKVLSFSWQEFRQLETEVKLLYVIEEWDKINPGTNQQGPWLSEKAYSTKLLE